MVCIVATGGEDIATSEEDAKCSESLNFAQENKINFTNTYTLTYI